MKSSLLASPLLLLVWNAPAAPAAAEVAPLAQITLEAALPLLPNGLAPLSAQDQYNSAVAYWKTCRAAEAAARRRAARGEISPAELAVFINATAQAQAVVARLKKVPPPTVVPVALPLAPGSPLTASPLAASPRATPAVGKMRQPFLATVPLIVPRAFDVAPPRLTAAPGTVSAIALPPSGARPLPQAAPRLFAALPTGMARSFTPPVAVKPLEKPIEKPLVKPLPTVAKPPVNAVAKPPEVAVAKPNTKPDNKTDNKADLERLAQLEAALHRADRRLSAASDALTEGQKQLNSFAGALRQAMLEAGPDAVGLHPFVKVAEKYAGTPYVWGGESRTGFDCSGMIIRVMRDLGYKALPHSAAEQFKYGTPIAQPLLKPGDLVFFANTYKAGISHVGIYLGKRRFIHAAGTGKGTIVSSLDEAKFQEKYAGARRLIAAR